MRAVNLLPPELRAAAPRSGRRARPEPVQGIGAYLVLGVLALCVTALAGYVLTGNGVKQRQADLVSAEQRTEAATAKAAALKPYADFAAMASARVATVRGLAAARFDWEQAMRDISHAIPTDAKLQTLTGDMGLPGTTGGTGDALRGSIQAPAISLTGCASDQAAVARMMARIKAVDGVTRVSLSKSEKPATAGSIGTADTGGIPTCKGENPPTYSMVIFFEGSAAAAALAPAEAQAASVPVPNVVADATPATGTAPAAGTTPPAGTAPAAGTVPPPAPTDTPTTTTNGSTP